MGTIFRTDAVQGFAGLTAFAGSRLELLVEAMGRLNYGAQMWDPKGISDVIWNGARLAGHSRWTVQPLSLDYSTINSLSYFQPVQPSSEFTRNKPVFLYASLELDASTVVGDSYVATRGWGKGMVWVNGALLGRYWSVGPQFTLYLPAAFLHVGSNEVLFLELEQPSQELAVAFSNKPDFGN